MADALLQIFMAPLIAIFIIIEFFGNITGHGK